jgi:hypothetical protein
MSETTLNEDDLKHLQQMTTRLQMMVYVALIKCSENRTANLLEVIQEVSKITHYSPLLIKDVYERLILDDHLRPKQGSEHALREGEYTIGGSRKWKRSY